MLVKINRFTRADWAAPTMTVAHLVFALATTAYILLAIPLEERDLVATFGERYVQYRRTTPKLIPRLSGKSRAISTYSSGDRIC